MTKTIYILNGPNLNLLGSREVGVYGNVTLADIEKESIVKGVELMLDVQFFQSNHEGELVDKIHEAATKSSGIIINAAAYTHTSVALHDALKAVTVPVIEVHLSNIFAREPFRHHSYISPVAHGVICGFGKESYLLAINAMSKILA